MLPLYVKTKFIATTAVGISSVTTSFGKYCNSQPYSAIGNDKLWKVNK